ncbi:MAG: hypothetical protein KCHDKBKB_00663 [Elusimicrobia bacterium]|nr:hypothetical protein [Elusimicrobiota bacterium]
MNKLFLAVLTFLILGIYIDVKWPSFEANRNYQTFCNGDYRQATLNISTIVPFRVQRETFFLGIGNKHFDQTKYLELECTDWPEWDQNYHWELDEDIVGCRNSDRLTPTFTHFIDLAFWRKPVQDPTLYYVGHDSRQVPQESYEAYKREWEKKDGQKCER